jgi:adenylate kinase
MGPVIILLFGPPGSGKGTQAAWIGRHCGIPSFSTGDMFRAECQAGTELGRLAWSILAGGGLVDDDIVNRMVARRISQPDCRGGLVLDGYPRTVAQAVFLGDLLKQRGLPEPLVIHLDVPADTVVARLCARRQCPRCQGIYNLLFQPPRTGGQCDQDGATLIQRADDREEVIRQRLAAYADLTGPVLHHYSRSRYHRIDGRLPPAEVSREIETVLNQRAAVA